MGLLLLILVIYGYFGVRSIYRLNKGIGNKKDSIVVVILALIALIYASSQWLGDTAIAFFSILIVGVMYYLVWLSVKKSKKTN